jgi:hypothetical protein
MKAQHNIEKERRLRTFSKLIDKKKARAEQTLKHYPE